MTNYSASWMEEEHVLLQDSVRKFAETELAPNEARWQKQGHVDRSAWRKAGEAGILCPSVPEEYGGAGCSFYHEAVILQECMRPLGVCGFATGNGVHSHIVAHYIVNYGSEEQKKRWLPKMASGEMIAAIAMTEPGTGSDLQAIKTTAIRKGDSYLINGSKTFVSNGQLCDLVILVAKTDPKQGAKGISLIGVEVNDLKGFSRGRNLDKIGMKSQDTSELFFDNVQVPAQNLLGGEEGRGFYQLMEQLPQERLSIAVEGVAVMEKALAVTVEYTRERKAFGKTLMDIQNTRFKLAEAKTIAHVARVFVDNCIDRLVKGELDAETASMAKWWVTQMQCEVVDECLQLHGGYGYMLEYPIAQMYTDVRVKKIYGGANEIMKELIARGL